MELIFRVGIFDVDDVMTNALGVMLGNGVLAMFKHRVPREALHVGECDTPGTIRGIAFSSS